MTRLALAGIALVSLVALSACSDEGAAPSSSGEATPSFSVTPLPTITPAKPAGNDPSGNPVGAAVTPEQKKYIKVSSKKGEFEGAVLERGQAACDRAGYVNQIDRRQLLTAIAEDEIPDVANAVQFLCPKYVPALVEAKKGFTDGSNTVAKKFVAGRSVVAGDYTASAPTDSCTWRVLGKDGAALDSGSNEKAGGTATLTISPKSVTVETSGCGVWLPQK